MVAYTLELSEDRNVATTSGGTMHVADEMIREEIRARGKFARRLNPCFTEGKFRAINQVMRLMKHRNFSKVLRMEELHIPREDGSLLRVVVFKPARELIEGVPGVLWIHGGGYGIGVPEQDFAFAELFEERCDCLVFMPDYTLATQAPFPAAFLDCYRTLLYMKLHAGELGIREDQIMTGGDSAGGGLCVAVDLMAKDSRDVDVAFTMPLYPMLDARPTPSSADNDAPVWNTRSNEAGWGLYLAGQEMIKYAVPALETDFAGFPPTLTYVGTVEPFHDETVEFVERLRACGVAVDFREYEGCYHAFDIVCAGSDVGRDARAFLGDGFERACRPVAGGDAQDGPAARDLRKDRP